VFTSVFASVLALVLATAVYSMASIAHNSSSHRCREYSEEYHPCVFPFTSRATAFNLEGRCKYQARFVYLWSTNSDALH
jgi:hypothetical protein